MEVMLRGILAGLHAAHTMRAGRDLANGPVIMVSAMAGSAHAGSFPTDECVPIDAWLTKPISAETLVRTVPKYAKHDRPAQRRQGAWPGAASIMLLCTIGGRLSFQWWANGVEAPPAPQSQRRHAR